MTVNGTYDKSLRDLVDLAQDQGWRIERRNNELSWYPPGGQGIVHTPVKLPDSGRARDNVLAELRRAGLQDRLQPSGPSRTPQSPSLAAIPDFARDLAGLVEQELERRTQNLVDQVDALRNENTDLRQRLADAESGVERRAKEAALTAVEAVLASRRSGDE